LTSVSQIFDFVSDLITAKQDEQEKDEEEKEDDGKDQVMGTILKNQCREISER
jgi:hypothetical protein